jgi:Glycosyltransferase family 87
MSTESGALRRALEHGLLGVLPVLLTAWLIYKWAAAHELAVDFDHAYRGAGLRVLHGANPYAATRAEIAASWAFVYPALAAVLFAVLALVPREAGDVAMTAACLAALAGTLAVLGVRDWRVYGAALLWSPVVAAWHTANVSLLLALAVALVWRHRDRPLVAGLLCAVAISVKPFVWPLALWLLGTRRYRAAGVAALGGLALNAIAWGVVGVDRVGAYLHLSSLVTSFERRQGYGVQALAAHIGVGHPLAVAAELALATVAAAATVIAGQRHGEARALTLAVAAMLLASPLLWNHYFVLAIVPLALARPRLSPAWLVPLALWACPAQGVSGWQVLVAWLALGGLFAVILRRPRRASAAQAGRARSRAEARGVPGLA